MSDEVIPLYLCADIAFLNALNFYCFYDILKVSIMNRKLKGHNK